MKLFSSIVFSVLIAAHCTKVPSKDEWYPTYHLAPPTNWMNDPNGLIYFNGKYHAFYQHDPDHPTNKLISWGHAESPDMVTWKHLPVAIRPSLKEDENGCFSGSSVDNNGNLTLIYTGNGDNVQVQCLASSNDSVNFVKHGCVLTAPDNNPHFRDPKVWKEDNGEWYMILGIKINDKGQVMLYKSEDLFNWKLDRTLAKANETMGYMWECPDFFKLGDKHVLLMSPQGIEAQGYDYRNLYQSGYYLGKWEVGQEYTHENEFIEIDHGHDFYAPQTLLTADGRRVMMAWMNMWEQPFPEQEQEWAGMFTFPRELTLKGSRIYSNPVKEIENYRREHKNEFNITLDRHYRQVHQAVKSLEFIININLDQSDAERFGIRLGDVDLSESGIYIYVDNQPRRLVLDRRYTTYGLSGYRSIALGKGSALSLRILFDSSSIEVFVNNGEATMSSRIFPLSNQRYLHIFAENGKAVVPSYDLYLLSSGSNFKAFNVIVYIFLLKLVSL